MDCYWKNKFIVTLTLVDTISVFHTIYFPRLFLFEYLSDSKKITTTSKNLISMLQIQKHINLLNT